MIKGIFLRFWLAINQSTCLMITGKNDFTISGWSYLRKIDKDNPRPRWANFVDWLFKTFKNQDEHCKHAFLWEWQAARKITVEHNAQYIDTGTELYGSPPINALPIGTKL